MSSVRTYYRPPTLYKICFSFIAVILLSACVQHDLSYDVRPAVEVTGGFTYADSDANITTQQPWWEAFERDQLNELVTLSFQANQNVKKAAAVLKQAWNIKHRTNTDRLPTIDLDGNARKSWEESNGQRRQLEAGASLDWDVDIFNRIGYAIEADEYEARAKAEDLETVKLILSRNVVNAYFGAAAAHKQRQLLYEQLKLDRKLQDLLSLRLKKGVGTKVDLLRQQARVADAEALLPLAEADIIVFENRLDVLLGQAPDDKMRVPQSESLGFNESFPLVGVPAALLLNRPDLRAKYASLVAADAEIGAAIADRLPQLNLSGSYAFSDDASFTGPVSLIMSSFVVPLLDWGKRKAEVNRNKALYEERLADYTQLYLEAIEEVESALIREQKQREFLRNLKKQIELLRQSVTSSEERFSQGVDDYLPVIDALQELRQIERDFITEQLTLIQTRIDLYVAIGGPLYHRAPTNKSEETHTTESKE
jgi:NodT family efflux transporter outer membrane factor (OMF) lipoprotein